MPAAVLKLHDPEDEVLGLVQGVQNLIARDRDRGRAAGPALDLDESKLARAWHPAFYVVPQFLELPVRRVKPKASLNLHNDSACPGGRFLRIHGRSCVRRFMPVHGIDEPLGDDQQSSQHHRGQRREVRLEPEFLKPFL